MVIDRLDILAADDLIYFCIYARRLLDKRDLRDLLYQAMIITSDSKTLYMWRQIFGYLIHHDVLMMNEMWHTL